MKSLSNQFNKHNSFYFKFLSRTILTLTILGVTVTQCFFFKRKAVAKHTATVSLIFTISYFCFKSAEYGHHAHQLEHLSSVLMSEQHHTTPHVKDSTCGVATS